MADSSRFPREIKIAGGTVVSIRPMTAEHRGAVLAFADGLPEEDLLFLRIDITSPEVVDSWIKNIDAGLTFSLLAFQGDRVVGYASVHRDPARWTRRVGEIRINIVPELRGTGLGRNLIHEIFNLARGLDLKKLTAHMTVEQLQARAGFKQLGFVAEAILTDHVEDREGELHDLLIMSYDVEGLTDQLDDPVNLNP